MTKKLCLITALSLALLSTVSCTKVQARMEIREGNTAYSAEKYDVALRHYAPAPIDKVLPLITQLAGAIDFARTAGVGHGALHPRDIFVTPEEARALVRQPNPHHNRGV